MAEEDMPLFIGQKVVATSPRTLENAKWLAGKYNKGRKRGTVLGIRTTMVMVEWVATYNDVAGIRRKPNRRQKPEDLIMVNYFSHTDWQLGERCLLNVMNVELENDDDTIVSSSCKDADDVGCENKKQASKGRRASFQSSPKRQKREEEGVADQEHCYKVVAIKTRVDVLWQDGTISKEVNSCKLVHVDVSGEHHFLPRQCVTVKDIDEDDESSSEHSLGIIQRVDFKQRIATVRWFNLESRLNGHIAFKEEEVSVFELCAHAQYDYSIKDVVVRLPKNINDIPKLGPAAAWFGCIIGQGWNNGDLEVAWMDGSTSKVGLNDVQVVIRYDDESSSESDSDSSTDSNSSDTNDEEEEEEEENDSDSDNVDGDAPSQLATSADAHANVEEPAAITEIDSRVPFEMTNCASGGNVEATSIVQRASGQPFKHFDIVKDASNHHFFSSSENVSVQRKWMKRVQHEWDLLVKNLPDTIYVRVYEERMDLLTAVIIGADGTPYHDGLYFFDIYFPPEYPDIPPEAYYYSKGLRINPNLYENGKVCLSLLNTWPGKLTSEGWDPKASNTVQVLLSIQSLVLTEKPFYNEPDFDHQKHTREGELNSDVYDENCFLLCCKSMLYLIRNPHFHFEQLVKEHFKEVGTKIVTACKAYLSGARVGFALNTSSCSSSDVLEEHTSRSSGFKLTLAKVIPKLETAFEKLG